MAEPRPDAENNWLGITKEEAALLKKSYEQLLGEVQKIDSIKLA